MEIEIRSARDHPVREKPPVAGKYLLIIADEPALPEEIFDVGKEAEGNAEKDLETERPPEHYRRTGDHREEELVPHFINIVMGNDIEQDMAPERE